LHDHVADGRKREGTAGMKKTEMADLLNTIGQDMLEEAAKKLDAVELGSAEASTADLPI
jgi:hypothetical protein